MMAKAPFMMPEQLTPATARPKMSIIDDWAKPQMSEPTSNTVKKTRKMGCAQR